MACETSGIKLQGPSLCIRTHGWKFLSKKVDRLLTKNPLSETNVEFGFFVSSFLGQLFCFRISPCWSQQDLSAVTAACMMMKRSVFEEVGGLEEELKVAFNDVDLCLRIREKGHLIVYDPQNNIHPSLFLFHSHSSSAPLISYIEMIQTRYSP